MPLYGYHCPDCNQETEVLQSLSAPAPKTCSHCGQSHLRKTLGSFSTRYNGSGFYSTDYAKKSAETASPELP